jgi:hypothetical protein
MTAGDVTGPKARTIVFAARLVADGTWWTEVIARLQPLPSTAPPCKTADHFPEAVAKAPGRVARLQPSQCVASGGRWAARRTSAGLPAQQGTLRLRYSRYHVKSGRPMLLHPDTPTSLIFLAK